ncbi:hypothetical protein FHS27_003674 [Rhodopirellula rubra]|uniref:Uncharacterized protein n=1 Tax=Aporhodopirellula rubra TaxID=980271 RepID=A0A7W5H5T8_9BACT|nr:hypothetical protein [Aporhodopirellula rubra]
MRAAVAIETDERYGKGLMTSSDAERAAILSLPIFSLTPRHSHFGTLRQFATGTFDQASPLRKFCLEEV